MAVVDRITELVLPLLESRDLSLYDVEMNGPSLRVTVDRPGGVLLDDLAELTKALSRELDEQDPIPGTYTLEVSSPGLERRLRTLAHFQGALDEEVSVKLGPHVEGERRLKGVVKAASEDHIVLVDDEGVEHRVALDDITKAVTVFEWGPSPKPGQPGQNKKKNPNANGGSGPDSERRAAVS